MVKKGLANMLNFDFISGEDFRISLENDYKELNDAMQVGAWKAVHVLAGSIIEAVLVDYLFAIGYHKEDPLRVSLERAITICKQEGILSEKTEHIAHAIQSYRNLIHPGRSIRLGETADESGAKIAQGLVDMVVSQVAANKQRKFGYTAEQIVKKIINDSSTVAILGHLLTHVTEREKERLLITNIPEAYVEIWNEEEPTRSTLNSLSACFRAVYKNAAEATKKKAAEQTIKIIKEEDQATARVYLTNFFRGTDLQYLSSEEVRLLKEYLLSILGKRPDASLLRALEGIGPFLGSGDIWRLMNTLVPRLFSKSSLIERDEIEKFLSSEYSNMPTVVKHKLEDYLKEEGWTDLDDYAKEVLTELRNCIQELFFPDFPDDLE